MTISICICTKALAELLFVALQNKVLHKVAKI
ncbi:unnamed protein product, partial [Vitis vinifera]|uniref:Uncharacterized protein n=1 Tax=Vitis vinifera TaxID=29760 RepID=D7U521_VITVI